MLATHTLTVATERSQRMHQRGHAFYGTGCPDRCEMAGKWAARRLITPRTFLDGARATSGLEDMAEWLGVMPADVWLYVADLDPDEWLIMLRLLGRKLACLGTA